MKDLGGNAVCLGVLSFYRCQAPGGKGEKSKESEERKILLTFEKHGYAQSGRNQIEQHVSSPARREFLVFKDAGRNCAEKPKKLFEEGIPDSFNKHSKKSEEFFQNRGL